jgi:Ca-activated chloride channel family protein
MLPRIDFGQIAFGEPDYLWLLVLPGLLLMMWVWRFLRRRADNRVLARRRTLPVRERFAFAGDLPFWLCLILAIACLIVAVARPHGPASTVRQGGVDLVILQDGSASMRVQDVPGNRYQRSMRFLRLLGDALSWRTDRVALALFAHIATPQIRLTTDPNTFFFFLDHLDKEPPFRIEEDTTWDTNLELGLHWGIRMIERDEEVHGRSANAKLFIVLSDGELWSGEVQKRLEDARSRNVPVFVVGVGTLGGGRMPAFLGPDGEEIRDPEVPLNSRLDRASLQQIAYEGGGQYFELDRDGDRHIANAIIDAGKRLAPSLAVSDDAEQLYWYFLSMAAMLAVSGVLFLRDRADLWLQLAGSLLALVWVSRVLN